MSKIIDAFYQGSQDIDKAVRHLERIQDAAYILNPHLAHELDSIIDMIGLGKEAMRLAFGEQINERLHDAQQTTATMIGTLLAAAQMKDEKQNDH